MSGKGNREPFSRFSCPRIFSPAPWKNAVAAAVIFVAAMAHAWGRESITWAFTDYAPANYVTEENGYSGYLYEIVVEAFENRLGIPVEAAVLPWSRCQRLVEIGEFDMFLTIPTAERLEYAVPTDTPVWVKRRIAYTYAEHPRMDEIQSLRGLDDIKNGGFTVVSYVGNGWIEDYVDGKGIPVMYAPSVESMYRMLDRRRADLVIEERAIAELNITRQGLISSVFATSGVAAESGFHILIGKRSEFLSEMDRLNAVVDEMWADGTIPGILERYGLSPER